MQTHERLASQTANLTRDQYEQAFWLLVWGGQVQSQLESNAANSFTPTGRRTQKAEVFQAEALGRLRALSDVAFLLGLNEPGVIAFRRLAKQVDANALEAERHRWWQRHHDGAAKVLDELTDGDSTAWFHEIKAWERALEEALTAATLRGRVNWKEVSP